MSDLDYDALRKVADVVRTRRADLRAALLAALDPAPATEVRDDEGGA